MTPELYCQEKAAPAGSSLYYSTLFHNQQQKRRLHALFALQRELLDTVTECQDAGIARIKLQWWCEEIDRLFSSQARHPVSKALQELMPDLKLEKASLFNLVNKIEKDLSPPLAESLQQLVEHFSAGRGSIWQIAAIACGCQDSQTIAQVVSIAGLSGCMESFQMARQQLNRGYCPYPRREMEKHGLNHETLLQQDKLPALTELQAGLYATIRSALGQNTLALAANDRSSILFALSMARIGEATCARLQKRSGDLSASHPLSLTPLRKLWIAWRSKTLT